MSELRFSLQHDSLLISGIDDSNLGRLARIEMAILKRIVAMECSAIENGLKTISFRSGLRENVHEALREFQVFCCFQCGSDACAWPSK